MKINQIHIREAWGLKNLSIKFDEPLEKYFENSKVSILVGENGTGKTSILRILSYAFFPDMTEKQELFPNFYINYEINEQEYELGANAVESYDIVRPSRVIVSSFAVFEAFKVNYQKGSREKNFVGEYAGTEYYYCGPTIRRGLTSLKEAIPTIVKSFYNAKYNIRLNNSVSELMTVINYQDDPSIEVSLPRRVSKDFNFSNYNENEYLLLEEKCNVLKEEIKRRALDRIGRRSTYRIPSNHIDERFLEMIFEVENSKYYSRIITDLVFKREEEDVLFSQMSSGELTMFFRFFPLIDKVKDNCVVLIDEPETHLHPKWIKNYIDLIVKIFGDYKVHFIIATHSPLIASDVPKESIIGLKRNRNNRIEEYYVKEKTLGGESSDILQDVFNLKDYSGEFTKSKKKLIKELLEESRIREALELYDDLSTTAEKYKFFSEIEHLLPDFGEE